MSMEDWRNDIAGENWDTRTENRFNLPRPPHIPYIVDWGGTRALVAHRMSLPTEIVFNP